MVEYGCLTFVIMAFLIACDYQFGSKYGAEWTYRTIIPKDSFWRKIYPFKETETNLLRYAKLIPFFITFVILMVVLIVYIVFWVASPPVLSEFLQSKVIAAISLAYLSIVVAYAIIIEVNFRF